jgi:phytoene desaturase
MIGGTWYPMGGMHEIVKAMISVAKSQGVQFELNSAVDHIPGTAGKADGLIIDQTLNPQDIIVASADYHHVDQYLLDKENRNYTSEYWDSRTMAPGSLIFYLGVDKKLKNLKHHNLFFDKDFAIHAEEIYENPKWPSDPLFYVCAPSVTDDSVAPEGKENIFILIPTAPELDDPEATREKYYNLVMERLETITGQDIRPHVIYKRSYAHTEFKADYHAFKGNAYGLANTLRQTAILKPQLTNKHLSNLYYSGQLTVAGPGVPPSIISGEVVANEIAKQFGGGTKQSPRSTVKSTIK